MAFYSNIQLRNARGSSTIDYLLITAIIAGVSFPIVMNLIGDQTIGTLNSGRAHLVSFLAQDRKRPVPNEWFNRERRPPFPLPDPNGDPDPNGNPPPDNPDYTDNKPDPNPPRGGDDPDKPTKNIGDNLPPTDPRYRYTKTDPDGSPPNGRPRDNNPNDPNKVWDNFQPDGPQPVGETDGISDNGRGKRNRYLKTGDLGAEGSELYAENQSQKPSQKKPKKGASQKEKDEGMEALRKQGGTLSAHDFEEEDGEQENRINWWWLIKIILVIIIIYLLILIILGNLRKK